MGGAVVFRDLDHSGHGVRFFADAQPKYGFLAHAVARILGDQASQNLISAVAAGAAQPESSLLA